MRKIGSGLGIFFKSYGQVIVCLNSAAGLLVCAAIFQVSRTIWLLTCLGAITANLVAFFIRTKSTHLKAGIYGFNGVVLGIAWPWFFRINIFSLILLVVAAGLSSLLMKLMIDLNSRTRVQLPVFSLPAVILIWFFFILSRYPSLAQGLAGPDRQIMEYFIVHQHRFLGLCRQFSWSLFFRTFSQQIIASLIIFTGVACHSRMAMRIALFSFLFTVTVVYFLEGKAGLLNIEPYLYNALPCSIALGGTFLVYNRRVFLLTILATLTVIWVTFLGLRYFILPVFVLPFNLVTIFFIWLVKYNFLGRQQGFFAVPMEFVSSPEFGLEWQKGEKFADDYWRQIAKLDG